MYEIYDEHDLIVLVRILLILSNKDFYECKTIVETNMHELPLL